MYMHTNTHLCAVFSLSLDKHSCLQIVVSAGPKGALEEGATFNTCLDSGQGKVLWKYHFTASNFILMEERQRRMPKKEVGLKRK